MRAVTTTGPGGPEVLVVSEVPDPEPGPGEVLLDVVAAGVNRADLLQRQGLYPPPPGGSEIIGLECSGLFDGRPVCALLSGGGYAERVAVPAGQVMPAPQGIDLIEAAALPEVACTVYSNLTMVASLAPAETLLVHGGGSGIGTFAIQYAVALGVRVIVTVGSSAKAEKCRELGAEVAIDYNQQDFVAEVEEVTAGKGADVILDTIGAKYLERNLRALATGGRLVVIGLQGGGRGDLDLGVLIGKRAGIVGTSLRARPVEQKAKICAAVAEHVWPLVAAGRIRPVIDRIVPLDQVASAHERVAASEHFGKLLLSM